ncbi:cytidine deaminase-like protein [Delitschia confertaspora ATCC 74209]|uniref:Cytidine deaminase-like protein n=1 Tax=Delitschia confertaspora ATCC 74209 TaxID=1513339 RepID=A0A9P4JD09_9PLEO|nr:cytidine deaminase-like protein [Delitschia confertaspora ATCC 74209]
MLPDSCPPKGRLLPLKTRDELRAALETIDVYAVEVPARFADKVLNIFRTTYPDLFTNNFQHIRRVAKFSFLPPHIQSNFSSLPDLWEEVEGLSDEIVDEDAEQKEKKRVELRYVITTSTSSLPTRDLLQLLATNPPFTGLRIQPQVFTVPIPALAPTSAEQAEQWSREYWPVSYRNTNPYGPHPALVGRNTAEIEDAAPIWLHLAEEVGEQVRAAGYGESVGCVITDGSGKPEELIAVAGDCRWRSPNGEPMPKEASGNVMAHCVQRAIAMVAKKRLRASGKDPETETLAHIYSDSPVTAMEETAYSVDNTPPNGYLCVDLDIYVSHEPCIMCSMAILHSRFRRCIIRRRMPLTGGLTAETPETQAKGDIYGGSRPAGLGCGMFWRPSELNWKFLAWELDTGVEKEVGIEDTLHA